MVEVDGLLFKLLKIDEALFAQTLSANSVLSESARNTYPQSKSRVHTAFGRISSFLSQPMSYSIENPICLAEAGLYNSSDSIKVLRYVMYPHS